MLLGRYYDGQLCRVKVVGTLSEEHIKVSQFYERNYTKYIFE